MKTSFIPSYYAANVERLARFAKLHVENTRKAIAENEAAGRMVVAARYRVILQKWLDVAGCPASFVNA